MRNLIENRITALLEGQDQVYYHGTRSLFPFNEFKPRMIGTGVVSSGQKFGGFFFTSERGNAEFYAEDFVAKIKINNIVPAPEKETHSPTVLKMAIESGQNLKLEDVYDGSMYSDIVVVPSSNVNDIEILEWIFVGDKEIYFEQLDKLFFNLEDYDPEDEDNIDDDGNVMPPYIDVYQIDSLLGQMELDVKDMLKVPVFNEYYNSVEERLNQEYGLKEIINKRVLTLLENIQKADKEFFNGKDYLNADDRQMVMDITGGDVFTYKVTELLDQFLAYSRQQNPNESSEIYRPSLQDFYNALKTYNASVFPLKGFLVDQPSKDVYEVAEFMKQRASAVERLRQLPKVVIRNLRHITQPEREYNYQMKELNQGLKSTLKMVQHISNILDEEAYSRVIKKAFHSKDLYYNFEHYYEKLQKLLDIETFDTRNIDKAEVKQQSIDAGAEILEEGENYLLMAVTEAYQLREISCNVHWCVTGEGYFETHTTIIPEMYVLLQLDSRVNNEDRLLLFTESDGMDYEDTSIVKEYGMPEMEWYNAHNEATYPFVDVDEEGLRDRVKKLTQENLKNYLANFEDEEMSMVAEFVKKAIYESLRGGLADGKTVEDISDKHGVSIDSIKKELQTGSKIEMEHVDDSKLAREIAMDHLWEIPDYYTRLEKMEKDAEKSLDEEWDYDKDEMIYHTVSIDGEFYHGTMEDRGTIPNLQTGYYDWDALWFSTEPDVADQFSDYRGGEGVHVMWVANIKSDKIVYLNEQDFNDIKEHYGYEDLREAIHMFEQQGFDGWQTLGSIDWTQYDDFAIWNEDIIDYIGVRLKINGEWTDVMPKDDAEEMLAQTRGEKEIDEANPIIAVDDIPKGHFTRNVGIVSW